MSAMKLSDRIIEAGNNEESARWPSDIDTPDYYGWANEVEILENKIREGADMDKITPERLIELERAEKKLHALEAGGVDNWQYYDEAMEQYREDIKQEKIEALLSDIIQTLGESAYEPSERGAGIAFHEDAEIQCMGLFEKYGVIFKGGY